MKFIRFSVVALSASLAAVIPDLQPKLPWVFFAKIEGKLEPLSDKWLGDRFNNLSVFTYAGPSAEPVEFSYDDKHVYTLNKPERQSVGFYDGVLVFGRRVPSARLKLDSDWELLQGPFFLCDIIFGPDRVMLHVIQAKNQNYCLLVDLFLLPYDRVTKSAVIPTPGVFPSENAREPPGQQVIVKPCSVHYLGANALSDYERNSGCNEEECDIYVNGKLQPQRKKKAKTLSSWRQIHACRQ